MAYMDIQDIKVPPIQVSIAILNGHAIDWVNAEGTAMACKTCKTIWFIGGRNITPESGYASPCKKEWEVPW